MATMNFVSAILRPGIQSIEIFGEGSMGNWVPVEKAVEGREIKFVVTTYPNFTLTSWEAYYADEYDDTVVLPLSSVTGESAWTFTMPGADVYIRCEAEYPVSPSGYTITTVGQNLTVTAFDTSQISSRIEFIGTMSNMGFPDIPARLYNDMIGYYPSFVSDTSSATLVQIEYTENFFSGTQRRDFQLIINVLTSTPPSLPYNIVSNFNSSYQGSWIQFHNYIQTFDDPSSATIGHYNKSTITVGFRVWAECVIGATPNFVTDVSLSSLLLGPLPPSQPNSSIRYIMSPENSGEVDSSAPSELVGGTTEFTFNWRIKAAYEFRRLTPFAVGEGSLEDDISYSLDSYDGDTRTYTFTVTQIPDWAKGIRVLIETIMFDDPNNAGGTNASDTSVGGDGTYDDSSDEVPLPAIPSGISASDSGLVTLFRPSITQVKDFGNYLWSNITDFIENLQKIFTSPMDYVIGFNIFPVTPAVGADRDIYIGNWLSNIQMPPVLNQFYEFNAGVIQVKEYFGSFLDYYPNTRARIMLPFIGDREININEIMGKTLHLWYRIDLLSGACVAILNINDNVYYQWNGNCAVAVPVTGSDWSRLYSGIARAGLIVGSAIAFGPAGGITASMTTETLSGAEQAAAVSAVSDSFANLPKGVPGVAAMRRNLTESLENISEPRKTTVETHSSRAIRASTMVRAVGYNVMSGSSRAQHTGDMTGAITIMGNRTPYLVLEYPDVNLPENYKHIFGYPSNQYAILGNLSGYTKCKEVMFESTTATDDEIEMIISALKGGVYL